MKSIMKVHFLLMVICLFMVKDVRAELRVLNEKRTPGANIVYSSNLQVQKETLPDSRIEETKVEGKAESKMEEQTEEQSEVKIEGTSDSQDFLEVELKEDLPQTKVNPSISSSYIEVIPLNAREETETSTFMVQLSNSLQEEETETFISMVQLSNSLQEEETETSTSMVQLSNSLQNEVKKISEVIGVGPIYRYGKASILEREGMNVTAPTLFHFGGRGERSSARKTWTKLENVSELNEWNVACVAVYKDRTEKPISAWRNVAEGVCAFVRERVYEGKMDPKNIYVDGYSNGGAGAYYTTLLLHGMSVTLPDGSITTVEVQKMTLIDGTLEGIIKSSQVAEILNLGVPLTIYASTSSYSLSKHGRELISEFEGAPGFTGIIVEHGHGSDIIPLVYTEKYGNHAKDGNDQPDPKIS